MGSVFTNPRLNTGRVFTPRQHNYFQTKKTDRKVVHHERSIQINICDWLKENLPDVHFRSDTSSGAFNSRYEKNIHNQQQSAKGLPDLTIFAARRGFHALMLELKDKDTKLKKSRDSKIIRVYKRNGRIIERDYKIRLKDDWIDLHIERQANRIEELKSAGYCAGFAVGEEHAIKIIRWYFGIDQPTELQSMF